MSITANETTTSDGEAVLAIVYRKQAGGDSLGTSLAEIKYHLVSSVQDWDEQYKTALEPIAAARADVVALTHTPRNLGQINIQILWYLP